MARRCRWHRQRRVESDPIVAPGAGNQERATRPKLAPRAEGTDRWSLPALAALGLVVCLTDTAGAAVAHAHADRHGPAADAHPHPAGAGGQPHHSRPQRRRHPAGGHHQVSNGGIIELAAGTYPSPSSGFAINDPQRGFTIRAAAGATVVIDGGGARDILRTSTRASAPGGRSPSSVSSSPTARRPSTASPRRHHAARPGDVHQCTFENNRSDASTGGGGIDVAIGSKAFFFDCMWSGNTAKNDGGHGHGGVASRTSTAAPSSTTAPTCRTTSRARPVAPSTSATRCCASPLALRQQPRRLRQRRHLRHRQLANPVSTPRADALVVNSTFVNNQAARVLGQLPRRRPRAAPSTSRTRRPARLQLALPLNSAHIGGGISIYRAMVEIGGTSSRVIAPPARGPAPDSAAPSRRPRTTATSPTGAPPSLTMRDTLVRGRSGGITTVAQTAGGIYAGGDNNPPTARTA